VPTGGRIWLVTGITDMRKALVALVSGGQLPAILLRYTFVAATLLSYALAQQSPQPVIYFQF
jgi:hypothetical protein